VLDGVAILTLRLASCGQKPTTFSTSTVNMVVARCTSPPACVDLREIRSLIFVGP
jgi:hypothetical protein